MARTKSTKAGERTQAQEYFRFTIWHLVFRLAGKFDSVKAVYISHVQGFGVAHIGLSNPKEKDGNGVALFFGMCGWRDCTGGRKALKYGRFNLFAIRWPRLGCRFYRVRKVLNAFAIWLHYRIDTRYAASPTVSKAMSFTSLMRVGFRPKYQPGGQS